jgi:hypothetical protein
MEAVAEDRDAGVGCQQDVAQELAMLGPHGALGGGFLRAGWTLLFCGGIVRKAMDGQLTCNPRLPQVA